MPDPAMFERDLICGAILAGGRGLRMNAADKGLLPFVGRPLIDHVIARLRPQVGSIIVSANRHLDAYARLGLPVVSDREGDFSGPLAGIARVLEEIVTPYVLVTPCDMPFLPSDLARRLMTALTASDAEAAIARGAGRLQPLCILLKQEVQGSLAAYREAGGDKARTWLLGLRHCVADFPGRPQAFRNINTPDHLRSAALI